MPDFRTLLVFASTLFLAFVLERLPMPDILDWLQPSWVILAVTILVLRAPTLFGLWLSIPLGLMLDAERGSFLGLHILIIALHIYLLQVLYKRIVMFNFIQQMAVVFLLVVLQQMLTYWVLSVLTNSTRPVDLWLPALTSALMWPWVYALVSGAMRKVSQA
ncbi:rod shape-determining protein MreD [Bacterioplanoides sp.]|uniref:rod shape-determining protein MreD n=1 Tax=Bacterioplanoides sp. TaxID=2066072 RepID=UPI003AFFA7AF